MNTPYNSDNHIPEVRSGIPEVRSSIWTSRQKINNILRLEGALFAFIISILTMIMSVVLICLFEDENVNGLYSSLIALNSTLLGAWISNIKTIYNGTNGNNGSPPS